MRTRIHDIETIVLSELLAYELGRSHGREQERRRRRRVRRQFAQEPVGVVEMICAVAIIVSVVAVLIVACVPT